MRRLLHIIKKIFIYLFLFILLVFVMLWVWNIFVDEPPTEEINFGITFSNIYAEELELDWKETYIAILDDLGSQHIGQKLSPNEANLILVALIFR